jgi:hypothetical protein
LTNPDLALMRTIRDHWGDEIRSSIKDTPIPERFLAALIANESGGNQNATRFEPGVFSKLAAVVTESRPDFQGIKRQEILDFVELADPSLLFPEQLSRLTELATSRGLAQIMGWHILKKEIKSAPYSLDFAVELLLDFADEFQLSLGRDFEQLFRCWNTGKPDGKTFDPIYVPNGLARMALYAELPAGGG